MGKGLPLATGSGSTVEESLRFELIRGNSFTSGGKGTKSSFRKSGGSSAGLGGGWFSDTGTAAAPGGSCTGTGSKTETM